MPMAFNRKSNLLDIMRMRPGLPVAFQAQPQAVASAWRPPPPYEGGPGAPPQELETGKMPFQPPFPPPFLGTPAVPGVPEKPEPFQRQPLFPPPFEGGPGVRQAPPTMVDLLRRSTPQRAEIEFQPPGVRPDMRGAFGLPRPSFDPAVAYASAFGQNPAYPPWENVSPEWRTANEPWLRARWALDWVRQMVGRRGRGTESDGGGGRGESGGFTDGGGGGGESGWA